MNRRRLAAALLWSPLVAQDAATLRHDLTAGAESDYGIEVTVDVEQQVDGTSETTALRFQLWFHATVEAAGPPARVAHRVQRVVATADSKLARVDYDSDRPGSEPKTMEPLAKLCGQTFLVHVDDRGRIERVEPPESLRGRDQGQLGGDFASLFAVRFWPLPEAAVARGDRWSSDVRLLDPKTIGKNVVPARHEVTALDAQQATVDSTFEVGEPKRAGVKFEVQTAKAHLVFDRAAGRVRQCEMELAARATRDLGGGRTTTGVSRVRVRLL